MKYIIELLFLLFAVTLNAQTNSKHVWVNGYTRSDGTQVSGHYRTAPNSTNSDNFSTVGNVNPYTGESGYIPSDRNSSSTQYSNTRIIDDIYSKIYSNSYNYGTSYDKINSSYSNRSSSENDFYINRITELENQIISERDTISRMRSAFYYIMDSIRNNSNVIKTSLIDSMKNENLIAQNKIALTDEFETNTDNLSNQKCDNSVIYGLSGVIFFLLLIIMYKK